jgi:hypothetical protein
MNALVLLAAAVFTVGPGAAPSDPKITFDQENVTAVTGQVLSLESVVKAPAGRTIAHLNVTSLDGVYVDLEDWSHDVTQPVPAGEETRLGWEVQAVNSGHFAIYAVLVPDHGPLIVSPPGPERVDHRLPVDVDDGGRAVEIGRAVAVGGEAAVGFDVDRVGRATGGRCLRSPGQVADPVVARAGTRACRRTASAGRRGVQVRFIHLEAALVLLQDEQPGERRTDGWFETVRRDGGLAAGETDEQRHGQDCTTG